MTDFEMHVDVDYTIDSDYHQNGRVEIQITLDEKSAVDFYHWLADGCNSDLVFNKNGCRLKSTTVSSLNAIPLHYCINNESLEPARTMEEKEAKK